MDTLTIILLALGLAMDCFAVSVVQGLNRHSWQPKAVLMAAVFGLFHFSMPIVGYYAGVLFSDFIHVYAPWIALILLATIGGKMIWESFHPDNNAPAKDWSIIGILLLALATSIDVLATGIIFVPYPDRLYVAVTTIGLVAAAFSLFGYAIGVFIGKLKINAELIGGIVLVLLGIKIFVEGICS